MKDVNEFLEELKEHIVQRNAMMHHPLMKRLYEGQLTREQVVGWARQFWVIPHTHMINNAGKLAHAQLWRGGFLQQLLDSPYDKAMTAQLGQAVMDEMGKTAISPQSHYDCYFDLTDALGIPREEMGNPETLLPNSLIVMHAWTSSALGFSLMELIGSHNFVNDHSNTLAYPALCKALMEHYGLSESAVTWFHLHGEVDKEHGAMSRSVLSRLIRSEDDQRIVRYAVSFGLGIKWTLFDGVWNAYVEHHYRI